MVQEHAVSLHYQHCGPPSRTSGLPKPRHSLASTESQPYEMNYCYVIIALDQQTASRFLDLISYLLINNKCTALNNHLVITFGPSKHERASCFLHFHLLGDSKHLTLMDKILGLLGDHPPCLFL